MSNIEDKRITINLSEYEGLHKTIKQKEEYIQRCVVEGKISHKEITTYLFSHHTGLFGYGCSIQLLKYSQNMTSDEVEKINNEKIKEAIKDIYNQKEIWHSEVIEIRKSAFRLDDCLSAGFLTRLKWLFTGVK